MDHQPSCKIVIGVRDADGSSITVESSHNSKRDDEIYLILLGWLDRTIASYMVAILMPDHSLCWLTLIDGDKKF